MAFRGGQRVAWHCILAVICTCKGQLGTHLIIPRVRSVFCIRLASISVGHMQKVHTQIRCRRRRRPIRVFTVCLHIFWQLPIKMKKYHPTSLKTEMDWSNWLEWGIPFDPDGLTTALLAYDYIFLGCDMSHQYIGYSKYWNKRWCIKPFFQIY